MTAGPERLVNGVVNGFYNCEIFFTNFFEYDHINERLVMLQFDMYDMKNNRI